MDISLTIQWLVCATLGLGALVFLLRRFGVLPWRKAGAARPGEGACGACAHCAAQKQMPAPTAGAAVPQFKRARLPGPPR
jgi:hypothetical protein